MNLILFESPFESVRLERSDPRNVHLRDVLRVSAGDAVFIGFVNGDRARAKVASIDEDGSIGLEVTGSEAPPPALPVALLIGLPRPHTARRILFEAASLGVASIHFFEAERGEPSYAKSKLWHEGEWRERLRLGAEQAFTTHVPEVAMHPDLQSALTALCEFPARIILDNYEADAAVGALLDPEQRGAVLALGPERGWSPEERDVFRRNGWKFAHLGAHVLRAETAVTAAVAAAATRMELWSAPTQSAL